MGKNLVRKVFENDGTWTAPPGVKRVTAITYQHVFLLTPHVFNTAGFVQATNNNQAVAWGENGDGQLGIGTVTDSSAANVVSGGLSWKQISFANGSTSGLTNDGRVFGWGSNGNGQLGTTPLTSQSSPLSANNSLQWAKIAQAGVYSHWIRSDGQVYACGSDVGGGAMGIGVTNTARSSPSLCVGGLRVRDVVNNSTSWTMFNTTSDQAFTCGVGNNGRLGDGTTVSKSTPTLISGSLKVKAIAQGDDHGVFLTDTGDLYLWGNNVHGQLGMNDNVARSTPTLLPGGTKWRAISAGSAYTLAVREDGALYSWGFNSQGQLGTGNVTKVSTPTAAIGGLSFIKVAGGGSTSFGLTADGGIYSWGDQGVGTLGRPGSASSSPGLVSAGISFRTAERKMLNRVEIDVVPGTTYSLTWGSVPRFGLTPLAEPNLSPYIVALEYFA